MNALICDAIKDQEIVEFNYDGGRRTVEPHCHGTSTAGNEVMRGYQTAGASSSGNTVGWKLFEVSKMSGIQKTGDQFPSARPGYNPADKTMKSVCCHV